MRTTTLAIAILATIVAFSAQAQVYKWKDAKGVTHYTQDPPKKGKYTEHVVRKDANKPVVKPTQAKAPESDTCASARRNADALRGDAPVQMDSNGDGKPDRTLADADRANQLAYAEAAMKANNCGGVSSLEK